MTLKTIVLDDFSGGDSGRSRPEPNILNTYRGINTWLYPAGIGPRPAIVRSASIYETGLPTGKRLRLFNAMKGQNFDWFVYTFGDGTVYSNNGVIASNPIALRGTVGGFPLDQAKASDIVVVATETGAGASLTATGTFTSLPAMPNAQRIKWFGDRLVSVNNIIATPPTLRFSQPADPATWDAADSQFVGPAGLAQGLYVLRDGLIIPKQDGTIWQFAGVIGFNDTLRQIDEGRTHPQIGVADGSVVGGSVLYYVTGNQMAAFTGAQVKSVPRPDLPPPVSGTYPIHGSDDNVGRVLSLTEDQHFLVLGTLNCASDVEFHVPWMQSYSPGRGWNRHTVPVTPYKLSAAAITSSSGTARDSARGILADHWFEGVVAMVVPSDSVGGTNSAIRVYFMDTLQEMPFSVNARMWVAGLDPRDGDTGSFVSANAQFAEWWAPDGSEVTVRSVLMDYTYDADSAITAFGATPNTLTMSILATEPADGTTVQESAAITFVPTGGSSVDVSDTNIKRGRQLFQFGDQGASGGFKIKITNWSGIVIRRFTIEIDLSERRD